MDFFELRQHLEELDFWKMHIRPEFDKEERELPIGHFFYYGEKNRFLVEVHSFEVDNGEVTSECYKGSLEAEEDTYGDLLQCSFEEFFEQLKDEEKVKLAFYLDVLKDS